MPPDSDPKPAEPKPLPRSRLRTALDVIGLTFPDDELTLMGRRAAAHRAGYGRVRALHVPWDLPPALLFEPRIPGIVGRPGRIQAGQLAFPDARRPQSLDELAFASIPQLAALLRTREV